MPGVVYSSKPRNSTKRSAGKRNIKNVNSQSGDCSVEESQSMTCSEADSRCLISNDMENCDHNTHQGNASAKTKRKSTSITVKNGPKWSEDEVHSVFDAFGSIVSLSGFKNADSSNQRKVITFSSVDETEKAFQTLNGTMADGTEITLAFGGGSFHGDKRSNKNRGKKGKSRRERMEIENGSNTNAVTEHDISPFAEPQIAVVIENNNAVAERMEGSDAVDMNVNESKNDLYGVNVVNPRCIDGKHEHEELVGREGEATVDSDSKKIKLVMQSGFETNSFTDCAQFTAKAVKRNGSSISVKGLPKTWSERKLKVEFNFFGVVVNCSSEIVNGENQVIIDYEEPLGAKAAFHFYNNRIIDDKEVKVEITFQDEEFKPSSASSLFEVAPSTSSHPSSNSDFGSLFTGNATEVFCQAPKKWERAPEWVPVSDYVMLVKVPLLESKWTPSKMIDVARDYCDRSNWQIAYFDVCGKQWTDPSAYEHSGEYTYSPVFDSKKSIAMLKTVQKIAAASFRRKSFDVVVVISPHCGELSVCVAIILAKLLEPALSLQGIEEGISLHEVGVRTEKYTNYLEELFENS